MDGCIILLISIWQSRSAFSSKLVKLIEVMDFKKPDSRCLECQDLSHSLGLGWDSVTFDCSRTLNSRMSQVSIQFATFQQGQHRSRCSVWFIL